MRIPAKISGSGGSPTLYRHKKTSVSKSSGSTSVTVSDFIGNVYVAAIMCKVGSTDAQSYVFDNEIRIRRDGTATETETSDGFTQSGTSITFKLGFTASSTLTIWYWSDTPE